MSKVLFPQMDSNVAIIDMFFGHPDDATCCAVEWKYFQRVINESQTTDMTYI